MAALTIANRRDFSTNGPMSQRPNDEEDAYLNCMKAEQSIAAVASNLKAVIGTNGVRLHATKEFHKGQVLYGVSSEAFQSALSREGSIKDTNAHQANIAPETIIGHSCDPNVFLADGDGPIDQQNSSASGTYKLIVALRDITAGQEITWDLDMHELSCKNSGQAANKRSQCKSPNCRGCGGGFLSLPEGKQFELFPYLKSELVEEWLQSHPRVIHRFVSVPDGIAVKPCGDANSTSFQLVATKKFKTGEQVFSYATEYFDSASTDALFLSVPTLSPFQFQQQLLLQRQKAVDDEGCGEIKGTLVNSLPTTVAKDDDDDGTTPIATEQDDSNNATTAAAAAVDTATAAPQLPAPSQANLSSDADSKTKVAGQTKDVDATTTSSTAATTASSDAAASTEASAAVATEPDHGFEEAAAAAASMPLTLRPGAGNLEHVSRRVVQKLDFLMHTVNRGGSIREFYSYDTYCDHSCDPNSLFAFCGEASDDGVFHPAVTTALKEIDIGEAITNDYYTFDEGLDGSEFMCECGAANCRGIIRG